MISIARNVERTGWLGLVRPFSQCSHPPLKTTVTADPDPRQRVPLVDTQSNVHNAHRATARDT